MSRITGAILVTAIVIATGYTLWTGALYLSTLIAWVAQ